MTESAHPALTERYVHAVVRRLPERNRRDVGRELRALIADETDARTSTGVTVEQAEREAIQSLGDPARLAASYADTPLQLIGPERFVEWSRLVRVLLAIVLPITAGAMILAGLLENASAGQIALDTFGALVAVTVHICFWVTLVFALIERLAPNTTMSEPWNLDDLPVTEPDRSSLGWTLVSSAAWWAVVTAAIVVQQWVQPVVTAAGDRAPVLDPQLWQWWLPYFVIVWLAQVALAAVAYRWRRWGLGEAVVNIVLAAAFVIPFVVLVAREQLVSPELMTVLVDLTDASIPPILGAIIIATAIAAALWDAVDGVLRAARAYRSRSV